MHDVSNGASGRVLPAKPWFIPASLAVLALTLALGAVLYLLHAGSYGFSGFIYASVDLPGFAATLACAVALALLCVFRPVQGWLLSLPITRVAPVAVAAGVLVLSVIGVSSVHHGYAFSMDEWMTRLQAQIFSSGRLTAYVDPRWRPFGAAIYDNFASYDPGSGALASNYRPGMAALFAAFGFVGLSNYTSAILNAVAVLLVARVARQMFPDQPSAPVIAVLMLGTSQQALAASLTSYAMSAHLCLNLLWLTLFLEDRWRTHVLAALVGVATASLHQVHMHLFFALPFLLTLLRPFRPSVLMLYLVVYGIGHLAVNGWDDLSFNAAVSASAPLAEPGAASGTTPPPVHAPGLLTRAMAMVQLPGSADLAMILANLSRLVAWQSLALIPLLIAGATLIAGNLRLRLLLASIATILLPYMILMPDQGHGWGYRYLHGALGHLALLAVPGWFVLARSAPGARTWVVACLILSPLVLIPLRAIQIESWVGPFARASELVHEQQAEVVIVDGYLVLNGQDIPRNAPLSPGKPIVLNEAALTPGQISELCARHAVVFLSTETFAPLGIPTFEQPNPQYADAFRARRSALSGCAL